MNTFQHTPDNKIIINDLIIPLEFFVSQEPNYSLPEGYIGRTYTPKKRNHITMLKGETPCQCPADPEGGHTWLEGDGYLAKESEYTAAYIESLTPVPPSKAEEDDRLAQNELWDIDLKCIRMLREYVLTQTNVPTKLRDLLEAKENRSKELKPKIIKDKVI